MAADRGRERGEHGGGAADVHGVVGVARDLVELGFTLVATKGTAAALTEAGIAVSQVNKVAEGRPHVVGAVQEGRQHRIQAAHRESLDRVRLDLGYYHRVSEDQILSQDISSASGFGSRRVNVGETMNRGVEALLDASLVRSDGFSWNTAFNVNWNKSKVIELGTETDRIRTGRILVNAPTAVGALGGVYNNLTPTFSLGCGTWGGSSTTENVNYMQLLNIKTVSHRRTPPQWFRVPANTFFNAGALENLRDIECETAVIVTDAQSEHRGVVDHAGLVNDQHGVSVEVVAAVLVLDAHLDDHGREGPRAPDPHADRSARRRAAPRRARADARRPRVPVGAAVMAIVEHTGTARLGRRTKELVRRTQAAGGRPVVMLKSNEINRALMMAGSKEQWETISAVERLQMESVQCYVGARGNFNVSELADGLSLELAGLSFEGFTWPDRFVATNIEYPFLDHGICNANMVVDPDNWAVVGRLGCPRSSTSRCWDSLATPG